MFLEVSSSLFIISIISSLTYSYFMHFLSSILGVQFTFGKNLLKPKQGNCGCLAWLYWYSLFMSSNASFTSQGDIWCQNYAAFLLKSCTEFPVYAELSLVFPSENIVLIPKPHLIWKWDLKIQVKVKVFLSCTCQHLLHVNVQVLWLFSVSCWVILSK